MRSNKVNRLFACALIAFVLTALCVSCGDPADTSEDATSDASTDDGDDGDGQADLTCEDDPGGVGCECESDTDCGSGLCGPSSLGGMACTTACGESCDEGWDCVSFPESSDDPSCLEIHDLCRPCLSNDECGVDGDNCVVIDPTEGAYCGSQCETDADCETGYECESAADVDGQQSTQCLPTTGQCGCSYAAIEDEASTTCEFEGCAGARSCTLDGLSDCDAAPPEDEVCDGLDNDCDGEIDNDFDDLDLDSVADCVDPDDDGDEVPDGEDNCQQIANADQADWDEDEIGDVCDPPSPPILLSSVPDGIGHLNDIGVLGEAQPLSGIALFTDDECTEGTTFEASADGDGEFRIEVTVGDDTTTTFWGVATTTAGTSGCSTTSVTYIEDSTSPDAPVLDSTLPAAQGNTRRPSIKGSAESGATVELYFDAACTAEVKGTGSAADLAGPGVATSSDVAENDTTTIYAVAIDVVGNRSACSNGISYLHDGEAPAAPLLLGADPESPSQNQEPTLSGTSDAGSVVSIHAVATCADAALGTVVTDSDGDFSLSIEVAANTANMLYASAEDTVGNVSECSAVAFEYVHDDEPPTFEGVDTMLSAGIDETTIGWGAASDAATETEALQYAICFGTTPIDPIDCTFDSATHGPVTGVTEHTIDGLDEGVRYFAVVKVVDEAGNEDANLAIASGLTLSRGVVSGFVGGDRAAADTVGCGVFANGTSFCLGSDGDSSFDVSGLSQVTTIATGPSTNSRPNQYCARHSDGTVSCWGGNEELQLGPDTSGVYLSPVSLKFDNSFVRSVSFVEDGICASSLTDEEDPNRIHCWGAGFNDNDEPDLEGVLVASGLYPWAHQAQLAMSASCSIGAGGLIACWEQDADADITRISTAGSFVDIAAGRLGIQANGSAYSWEFPTDGSPSLTPVNGLFNLTDVSASAEHACGRRSDGIVVCWGSNDEHQLTDNTANGSGIVDTGILGAQSVSVGTDFSCALSGDGRLSCFGGGYTATPAVIDGLVSQLATTHTSAGDGHSCSVRSDGTARCWGRASSGELGNPGASEHPGLPLPLLNEAGDEIGVGETERIIGISAGTNYTCLVTGTGKVFCAGDNSSDQLGLGDAADDEVDRFTLVEGMTNTIGVSVGLNHTCAWKGDGRARCWGENEDGQLGDAGITPRSTPTEVSGLSTVHEIHVGDRFSCARDFNSQVKCWGHRFGQVPVSVTGGANSHTLSVGGEHACASYQDGSVACWGDNSSDQLGASELEQSTQAVPIEGVGQVIALAAGGEHTCALRADGQVLCWGANANGQLGNDDLEGTPTPTLVSGLSGIRQIEAGRSHTCAIDGDGVTLCFGNGSDWRLGGPEDGDRHVPEPVQYLP